MTSALVSYWSCEESSGTKVYDAGTAGNVGTLDATYPPTWMNGIINKCLHFIGPSQTVALNPNSGMPTTKFSVTCWVKVNVHTASDVFIQNSWASAAGDWVIYGNASNWQFGIYGTTPAAPVSIAVAHNGDTGWHHLCMTWDGSTLTAYVDGASKGTAACAVSSGLLWSALKMGTSNSGSDVEQCQFMIFNRALAASEVALLAQAPLFSNSNLVAEWPMGEGSGTSIYDGTGDGNTGTTHGSPTWVSGPPTLRSQQKALKFVTASSQYVSIPDAATLDITGKITVSFWAKFDAVNIIQDIVCKGAYFTAGKPWGFECQTDSTIAWSVSNTAMAVASAYASSGVWYHICGTYDGATGSLYINGVLQQARSVSPSIPNTADAVTIGSNSTPANYCSASVADVRIYSRSLSAFEVWMLSQGLM